MIGCALCVVTAYARSARTPFRITSTLRRRERNAMQAEHDIEPLRGPRTFRGVVYTSERLQSEAVDPPRPDRVVRPAARGREQPGRVAVIKVEELSARIAHPLRATDSMRTLFPAPVLPDHERVPNIAVVQVQAERRAPVRSGPHERGTLVREVLRRIRCESRPDAGCRK